MKYQVSLTLSPSTPILTPTTEEILLPFGELREISVYFPWGCAGLAHIRIKHNEHVLYPTTSDEWFEGNDILIAFECLYELGEAWNHFKVEGYSEDDFETHTPIVSFVVLPATGLFRAPMVWVEG